MANEYFTYYKAVDPFSTLGEIKSTFKPLEEPKEETLPITRLEYIEQKKKERDSWFNPEVYEKSTTTPSTTTPTTRNPYKGKNEEWKRDIYTAYKKELEAQGINTGYAKYLVAQDILESGSGSSVVGSYNYGNLTGKTGTRGRDHDANGKPITQTFLNFNSLDDYVKGKIAFLKHDRYKNQGIFSSDPKDFAKQAKAAGYAEDKDYVNKVNNIAKTLTLE